MLPVAFLRQIQVGTEVASPSAFLPYAPQWDRRLKSLDVWC